MSQEPRTPRARHTAKKARGHRTLRPNKKGVARELYVRTPAEELWCRRRKAGLTGPEAAEDMGIGRTALWSAEAGGQAAKHLARLAKLIWREPPGLPELLALARRRQGWGLLGTSFKMGVSHTTLLKMEREGDKQLMILWESLGFSFTR